MKNHMFFIEIMKKPEVCFDYFMGSIMCYASDRQFCCLNKAQCFRVWGFFPANMKYSLSISV